VYEITTARQDPSPEEAKALVDGLLQKDQRVWKASDLFSEGQRGKLTHHIALILAGLDKAMTCKEIAVLAGESHVKVHQALGYIAKKAQRTGLGLQVEGAQRKKTHQLLEVNDSVIAETPYHGESPRNIEIAEIEATYEGEVPLFKNTPINADGIVNNATFISLTPLELRILHFFLEERRQGNAVRVSSLFSDLGIIPQDYERLRKKVNKCTVRTGLYIHSVTRGAQYTALSFLNTKKRYKAMKEENPGLDVSMYFDEALPFDKAQAGKYIGRRSSDYAWLSKAVISAQASGELTSIARVVGEEFGSQVSYHKKRQFYEDVRACIKETHKERALKGGYLRVTDRNRLEFVVLRKPNFQVGKRRINVDQEPELFAVASGRGAYANLAKNRIIEGHMGLIIYIAKRVDPGCSYKDELRQEGMIAVNRAIDGFDLDYGSKFLPYVWKGIERAMRRKLSLCRPINQSHHTQEQIYNLNAARRRLAARYGVLPAEVPREMLANFLDVSLETIDRLVQDEKFEVRSTTKEEGGVSDIPREPSDPVMQIDLARIGSAVRKVLESLPEKDRLLVERRLILRDLRQEDLAPLFGVRRSQVGNIEAALKARLAAMPELQRAFERLNTVRA